MSANHHVFQAGPMENWSQFSFELPGFPKGAKQFLKEALEMKGMEISLNCMKPGQGMPFVHRHKNNEETYIFLSGVGEFYADGERISISAGTCVCCSKSVERTWRNTGQNELLFVVVQASETDLGSSTVVDGEGVPKPVPWTKS